MDTEKDVFDSEDLKQSYQRIKTFVNNMPVTDDAIIPLTYLIQALYPNAFKHLQENFNKQYTLGYMQAIKDREEKEKENAIT